jgi:hypothetical protein
MWAESTRLDDVDPEKVEYLNHDRVSSVRPDGHENIYTPTESAKSFWKLCEIVLAKGRIRTMTLCRKRDALGGFSG